MSRFASFERTELGQKLKSISQAPERIIEYRAFSREGFPAVTALVSEVGPLLKDLAETDRTAFNFAKQSIGDWVAKVMIADDYEKVGQRSVPGKVFSTGAMWRKKPVKE
ncbi:hypothetical protein [Novosphingobium sp.]|uniref:hypothetical protein n=1 Tax=Novosphingobium sp. TaxID=1874826 RepID=UPI0026332EE8|nr:hypothetical protein [Novosphingobium sp.]